MSELKHELGLIALESCKELGEAVDKLIQQKRNTNKSFLIPTNEIRFSNGEGKVKISESVRGKDIYILCDIGNYSCTYKMFGFINHKGPDEHFQDIKRTVSAIRGKAAKITVIMPLLYESRQHRRKGRESLDCALALQELERLGVHEVLTFDVHDPNVQNAIPLLSFENFYPTYDIVKSLIKNENTLELNNYNHYEISNFSKKGKESKHNVNCWFQKEYVGIGVAAHSYLKNIRYTNTDNVKKYISKFKDIEKIKSKKEGFLKNNYNIEEEQSLEERKKEYMLLGLRKIEGVQISKFKEKYIDNPIFIYKRELEKLINEELIIVDGDYIRLTNKGLDLANLVWEEFI